MNKPPPRSPLAPDTFPRMPIIPGLRIATAAAGSRYTNRDDLLIVAFNHKTTAAGVFTQSSLPAAPVVWSEKALRGGAPRALIVNAGNANAFTGAHGHNTVKTIAAATARLAQCRPADVLLASTGVIGEPLDPRPITRALRHAWPLLDSPPRDPWTAAATAITTTDTFPKIATQRAKIGNTTVSINGIAKGSGMIAPNMATMLAFIFTDARLPASLLRALLADALPDSFNAITVDGDTSTNDTLLLFATGETATPPIRRITDPAFSQFRRRFRDLLQNLAFQIVRDGEGATKFVSITVNGAASKPAARRIALSVANSPLVKTAIAGQDANWGRIIMAIGKSGEKISQKHLAIKIGPATVARNGAAATHNVEKLAQYMQQPEITLNITVGTGNANASIHTCDLSHGYVSINADYRS